MYYKDRTFEQEIFIEDPLPPGEYENCHFSSCIFSNSSLAHSQFTDCTFDSCDLSMVNIQDSAFRNVNFRSCKMLGLQFDACNPFLFEAHFEDCILNMANFFEMNLTSSSFKGCSLIEVDFSAADMSGLGLENCECSGATFDQTNLQKADLTSAISFIIDPTKNRVRGAKFAKERLEGLVQSFNIEII